MRFIRGIGIWSRDRHVWLYPLVALLLPVFTALVFRVVLPGFVIENTDYAGTYEATARNIQAGNGFIGVDGRLYNRYPPAFPVLIAGNFILAAALRLPEAFVLSVFSLLCYGLSGYLLYMIASSVWGAGRGLITSLVWATYPFMLILTTQPTVELPFMVFLFGALAAFWYSLTSHSGNLWLVLATGILCGLTMLTRAIAIGLPVVMLIQIWWYRVDRKYATVATLLLLVGCLLVVVPWELFLYGQTGRWIAISARGNLSMYDGLTFAVGNDGRVPLPIGTRIKALQMTIMEYQQATNNAESPLFQLGRLLFEQPISVLELILIKMARSWYGTDSQRYDLWIAIIQVIYLSGISVAAIRAWREGAVTRHLVGMAVLLTLYFWTMTTSVLSILRYMVPAMGVLMLLMPALAPKTSDTKNLLIST